MKKFTIASLLALSATCICVATACGDENNQNNNNNSPAVGETRTITFEAGEGYSIVGDGVSFDAENNCWVAEAVEGTTYSFALDVGAFYTGIPTVTVGNVALSEANGTYSFNVAGNSSVEIEGIFKDVSTMLGTGAFSDAFVISRPIDLLYIAEQVNAGNETYSKAAYVLANDIDCKGETIEVIGDSENNPFSGCFTCLTNTETGEMERYAISNFKIDADDSNYVGLFGCVQVDMSVTSSGLFYGIRIKDFEISASTAQLNASSRNIYCGGLIGYGLGVRAYLCDATNGTIDLTAAVNEFSFVGGLIGVQQAVYMQEYNQFYPAETAYANVDVDISVINGTALYAGGIAGYLYTNSFITPSYIHNSYATGNVNGAVRTGGIVGGLGQYTSVASSYSSGSVHASAIYTKEAEGIDPEYCVAYAGGIAGFAENDTVVNNCFAVGKITAHASDGHDSEMSHFAIGGGDDDGKVSVASRKYVVYDCLDSIDKNAILTTITETLGWQTFNWNITDTAYPTINYDASSDSVTTSLSIQYVDAQGNPVKVENEENEIYSVTDSYEPIANAFVDGYLDLYLTADNKSLSFGYFFDKECTQPVPYSFLTTRSLTLYVGFVDPTNIVGEYTLAVEGAQKPLMIKVLNDGRVECADGTTFTTAYYQYDGKTLLIEGARLARYFLGEVDKDQSIKEDAIFDLNRYTSYYFMAKQTEAGLDLYDGTYFTEEAPLKAYSPTSFTKIGAYYVLDEDNEVTEYVFHPDGTGTRNNKKITYTYADGILTINDTTTLDVSTLNAYDNLKGVWQKSASVQKQFTFDGIDKWESYVNVEKRDMLQTNVSFNKANKIKGTYATADNGTSYILYKENGDEYATVTFDEYGFLKVSYKTGNVESYSADNSFLGEWKTYGITLRFDGINKDGVGEATATFETLKLSYSLTYSVSETTSPYTYVCMYYENEVFGYFYRDALSNTLLVTMFDPTSEEVDAKENYATYYFSLVNVFNSIWISNDVRFDDINFDGIGAFNSNGDWVGQLTLDGKTVDYTLIDGSLDGYFYYEGERYTISYDIENGIVFINTDITLERKDSLADIDFVSINNGDISSFAFDGKSNLTAGGQMQITLAGEDSITYTYKKSTETAYTIWDGTQEIGSIVLNEKKACYDITLNGINYPTYIRNDYIGSWALSGEFEENAFVIGATDLNGYIHGTFRGESIKIKELGTDYYSFSCEIDGMPVTYYMYMLYDNETQKFDSFAISEYSSLVYSDYILCSHIDPIQGEWKLNGEEDADFTISFDGVQSSYSNGIATLSYKGYPTYYNYRIYTDSNGNVESVMLWSQNTYNGSTLYYKLEPTSIDTKGAFVRGDKAYIRSEIDSLYKMEARGNDGYVYTFDGGNLDNDTWGTITAKKAGAPTRTLEYDIVSFNDNQTATITVKEMVDGKEITYTATLDYSRNNANKELTISFVESEPKESV